jgi:glucose-1-phosphate thymidylyltransferase
MKVAENRLPQDCSAIGSHFNMNIGHRIQASPAGAGAFIRGEEFLREERVALILEDNLFYDVALGNRLKRYSNDVGANIFVYVVSDPARYGVIQIGSGGSPVSIEEEPSFQNPI